jgi:hypothetical protein
LRSTLTAPHDRLAARAVRPGRIPAKASCRPEDTGCRPRTGLMMAIGIAAGGRPMANEIFKAPAGFLAGAGERRGSTGTARRPRRPVQAPRRGRRPGG